MNQMCSKVSLVPLFFLILSGSVHSSPAWHQFHLWRGVGFVHVDKTGSRPFNVQTSRVGLSMGING